MQYQSDKVDPMIATYNYGVLTGILIEEGLKKALGKVSPEELTPELFCLEGLNRISNFNYKGGTGPHTYELGVNTGWESKASLWKMSEDGKHTMVKDWFTATNLWKLGYRPQ